MTIPEVIAYIRSRKGGQRPRDSRSFTEWKFGELCECIGFHDAQGFARYVDTWNSNATIVKTYKQFLEHENSIRPAKID